MPEYVLTSTSMIHTPGIVGLVKKMWKSPEGEEVRNAINIMSSYTDLPIQVAVDYMNGELNYRVDKDAGTVTIQTENPYEIQYVTPPDNDYQTRKEKANDDDADSADTSDDK